MPCSAVLLIVFATLFFNQSTSIYIKPKYIISIKTFTEKLCHEIKLFSILFNVKYLLVVFKKICLNFSESLAIIFVLC